MRCLFIDSRDRISGTTTDFKIQLPTTLTLEQGATFRIDNLRVPMVIPLIRYGVNDRLYIKLDAGGLYGTVYFQALLQQGSYAGIELAALIQTAINSGASLYGGTSFSCEYDEHTASMTLTCSSKSFEVLKDDQAASHFSGTIANFATALFANNYQYDDLAPGRQLYWSHVSMVSLDMFYLSSSKLSNPETFGPQGASDTLMAAITSTDFATVMDKSMPYDVWLTAPAMTTQQLDFQLRDRACSILTGLPNISFTLTIR